MRLEDSVEKVLTKDSETPVDRAQAAFHIRPPLVSQARYIGSRVVQAGYGDDPVVHPQVRHPVQQRLPHLRAAQPVYHGETQDQYCGIQPDI